MFPCRVVLRNLGNEYVVHTERLESALPVEGSSCAFRHAGFDNGDYRREFQDALQRFLERSERL